MSTYIDFREKAPYSANRDMFLDSPQDSRDGIRLFLMELNIAGPRSIGIPGEIRGLEMAFKKYGSGKITWKEVVEPALLFAREGHIVTEPIALRVEVLMIFLFTLVSFFFVCLNNSVRCFALP